MEKLNRVVGQKNPITSLINYALGFIRALMFMFMVRMAWGVIYSSMLTSLPLPPDRRATKAVMESQFGTFFCRWWILCVLSVFLMLALADLTVRGSTRLSRGLFQDRIKLGYLLHLLGFRGTDLDIFWFRLLLWSSIYVGIKQEKVEFGTFYQKVGEFKEIMNIGFLFQPNVALYTVIAYIIITAVWYVLRRFSSSVAHPWLSSYDYDAPSLKRKTKFNTFDMALLIINVSVKLNAIQAIVVYFAKGDLHAEFWDKDIEISFFWVILAVSLGLALLRELFVVYNSNVQSTAIAVYFFDSLHMLYLMAIVHNHTNTPNAKYHLYISLAQTALNLALYLVYCFRQSVRHFAFCVRYILSTRMLANVAYFASLFLIVSALVFNMSNYHQQWFTLKIELASFMTALLDVIKGVKTAIQAVIDGLTDLVTIVFSNDVGTVVCYVVIIALILAIVLSIIPFGFGAFGAVLFLLSRLMRAFLKFAIKIIKMLPGMMTIMKYLKKFEKLETSGNEPLGDIIGPLILLSGQMPVVLGFCAFAVAFFERTSKISMSSLAAFPLLTIILSSVYLGYMALLKFVLVREFNLGVVKVGFEMTQPFVLTILSSLLGICAMLLFWVNMCSSGVTELEEEEKTLEVEFDKDIYREGYPLKSKNATTVGGEVMHKESLCGDLFYVSCPCFRKKDQDSPRNENGCSLCKLICVKAFCCCCQTKTMRGDSRPVCKYAANRTCPCQHDDDREDFCRRNKECTCCCFKIECEAQDVNKYVNIMELGRLALLNVYFLLIIAAFVMAYWSFKEKWYLVNSSLGPILADILGDNGPDANNKEFESQSSEKSTMCAGEIELIISMFMKVMMAALDAANPEFRKALEKLREIRNGQGANVVSLMFNMTARLLLLWPMFFSAAVVFGVTVLSAFTGNLFVNLTGILVGLVLLTSGMTAMIGFESQVNAIFQLIPFIELEIRQTVGWNYGFAAFLLVLVALGCFAVDYLAPPLAPKMPLDLGEQIKREEKDLDDVLVLHIEKCEDIVAKAILSGDLSFFD